MLPVPVLGQVASSLRSSAPRDQASGRQYPRTPWAGTAVIIRCDGPDRKPLTVRIRDVSCGGIGLFHSERLSPGERFIAVLPPALSGIARGVLCTVAHSTAIPAGGFHVGARFDRLIKCPTAAAPATPAAPDSPPQPAPAAAPASARPSPSATSSSQTTVAPKAAAPAPKTIAEIPQLLTRDECVARAEKAMQARTLSGVVAQVISLAASPRGDTSELASLISRDPMLSARILQAANSVSYTSTRGMVSTISEAVRNIGCAAVRDIAASLGVFDAMPACSADGFNPIRCWQHSFATATICQRLAGDAESGTAYLIGLCHDLGEILFQTHFGSEYRQIVEAQAATGRRRDELERKMLGVAHGELVVTILRCLGLPDAIRAPIEAFHKAGVSGRGLTDARTRLLRAADLYANGLLLASSTQSPLMPLSKPECRAASGAEDPPAPDAPPLRSEILALTAMLARLTPRDEAELMAPLYPHKSVRVWLAREKTWSSFDPVAAALEALSDVTVQNRLPDPSEAAECAGIVVVSRTAGTAGFTGAEIARAAQRDNRSCPVLWLAGSVDGAGPLGTAGLTPSLWPVPLATLAEFVARLGGGNETPAVPT